MEPGLAGKEDPELEVLRDLDEGLVVASRDVSTNRLSWQSEADGKAEDGEGATRRRPNGGAKQGSEVSQPGTCLEGACRVAHTLRLYITVR